MALIGFRYFGKKYYAVSILILFDDVARLPVFLPPNQSTFVRKDPDLVLQFFFSLSLVAVIVRNIF